MKGIDLTEVRVGRLTVKYKLPEKGKNSKWFCICDCGKETIVYKTNLMKENTRSCGCLSIETKKSNITHGKSHTAEYRIWLAMKRRCDTPSVKMWHRYGGRGIKVCDRWKNDFSNFLLDMGKRPSKKHSIDRIDIDKDYSPDNCRWATTIEQANNKSSNGVVNGISYSEAASIYGIPAKEIGRRLCRGWTTERALSQPLRGNLKTFNGL